MLITENFVRDQLSALQVSHLSVSALTDSILTPIIKASEKRLERVLKVPLHPTEVFADQPTSDEITALNGAPYIVEPGYDMPPDFLSINKFGAMKLRITPVIEIINIKMTYPSIPNPVFEVPKDWIRLDKKYGQLHIFPGSTPLLAPMSVMTWQAMMAGVNVPNMLRVRYRAGVDASSDEYADIQNLIFRMTVLALLNGKFLPQSGSISSDGLTESSSINVADWQKGIDLEISALKESLIGPVWGVL